MVWAVVVDRVRKAAAGLMQKETTVQAAVEGQMATRVALVHPAKVPMVETVWVLPAVAVAVLARWVQTG